MASLTLTPKYITDGSSFGGVLNGGEDYRTFASGGVTVGTIAFDTSALHARSAACELLGFSVSFQQKCNRDSIPEMWWNLTPRKIKADVSGSTLGTISYTTSFGRVCTSKTNGNDYVNKSCTFLDSANRSSADRSNLFGGSHLLAFYLSGSSERTFDSRLYMKGLSATVEYTPKYYARFYAEDGTTLLKTQTCNAYDQATPPSVSRTGYYVQWKQIGTNNEYTDRSLPSSVDTDIAFQAVYYRSSCIVSLQKPEKGSLELYLSENGSWVKQSRNSAVSSNDEDVYSLHYGDSIRVMANGCTTLAEDLVVLLTDNNYQVISQTTKSGASSTNIEAYSGTLSFAWLDVSVSATSVTYQITTSKTGSGTITPSFSASRGSTATVLMKPNTGWILSSYTVDGNTRTPTASQKTNGILIGWDDVNSNHTVSATFTKLQYAITFNLPTGVTVEDENGNTLGSSVTVDYGSNPSFTFKTDNSRSLTGVTVDGESTGFDTTFKQRTQHQHQLFFVTEPHNYVVTATSDLVTISIDDQLAHATITGDTGTYIRQAQNSNNKLTFTIAVEVGYGFVKWDDDTTTIPLTFAPTGTRTVSATLEALDQVTRAFAESRRPYYKNATDNDKLLVPFIGGKVSAKGQTGNDIIISAKTSDTTPISFVADPGFQFESALVRYYDSENYNLSNPDRTETTTSNPFNLNDLAAKRVQIEAYFKRLTYEVDVTPKEEAENTDGSCNVSVSPEAYTDETYTDPKQYFFESELQLNAIPGEGWYFDGWSDTDDRSEERTLNVPANDVSITATFKKFTYHVDVTANKGGTASPGQAVEHGDDLVIEITADYGQKIKDVLLDGESAYEHVTLTRRGGTFRLINVKEQHSVEIVFTPKIYTNGRRLIDYYPPVIASIRDIQRLMDALQIQNDAMWDAISFAMDNQFIDTATNEGVTMWEHELGIVPEVTDTLTERKARLRLKWVPNCRFTMKWLQEWLDSACGMHVDAPTITDYTLRVVLPWSVRWKAIFDELENFKPANILLDRTVKLPEDESRLLAGFATETTYFYTEIPREIESEDDA